MTDVEYPPAEHVLRDLPFEIEVLGPQAQRGHLATYDWDVGSLATVVDVLCGSLCAGVVAPDWMATSTLTMRLGAVPSGPLVLDASVLRAGSRSVTLEVEGSAPADGVPGGHPVLAAMLGFSRLERRADNLDLSDRSVEPGTRYDFGRPAGGARPGFTEALEQRAVDAAAGVTLTPVTDYLRNSFGAVNGGVVAAIAAGAALAGAGDGSILEEVAVHHLGQGRHGPVATTTRVALRRGRRTVRRVELRDTGAVDDPEGRLMAVAHVGMYDGPAHV